MSWSCDSCGGSQYDDHTLCRSASAASRQADALERIARALERIADHVEEDE